MTLKKGSKGPDVEKLQAFLGINPDGDFGAGTEKTLKAWQTVQGLPATGIVDAATLARMGVAVKPTPIATSAFDEKYKDVTIQGSTFPDQPIDGHMKIRLSPEMEREYLPALQTAMGSQPKGFKLLCTIMAHKEGFKKGTRSYKTNNPGNIGNTDSGQNKSNRTLVDGILMQQNYILNIVNGKSAAFPMGKQKTIAPYFSPEIAKNAKNYGMNPFLPGYNFVFTGQLDQFVKIYSTGARGGNGYLSMIISYFNQNGMAITAESKLQDIIKMG